MKDEEMTFWTTSPHFLLVATYGDVVVGMVAIQRREETGLTTLIDLNVYHSFFK
jgi:hypothetical protein